MKILEEFVCHLYGGKGKSVDELRYKKFEYVYRTKNKMQDLSLLPSCQRSLFLHQKRANYIARIWKLCFQAIIDFEDIDNHGWNSNGTIHWTTEEFPDDIIEILTNENDGDNEQIEIDEPDDSDEECDFVSMYFCYLQIFIRGLNSIWTFFMFLDIVFLICICLKVVKKAK